MAWLAALAAAGAAWWALPGVAEGLARLDAVPAEPRAASARRWWAWAAGCGAAGLVVVTLAGGPGAAAVALAIGQLAGCGAALGVRRARRRARARGRTEVVRAGELVAGLLRVGRVPSAALVEAAADAPVLREAAAELRAGGEAAAALRRSAAEEGSGGLGDLAAAWDVALRTGGSLTGAVDAAAARLAADDDVARVVDAELAAARLGGRVMALLPAVGVALGYGFGGDPLAFLTASPLGWACLDVGVALACAGVWWIDVVAERAGGR